MRNKKNNRKKKSFFLNTVSTEPNNNKFKTHMNLIVDNQSSKNCNLTNV